MTALTIEQRGQQLDLALKAGLAFAIVLLLAVAFIPAGLAGADATFAATETLFGDYLQGSGGRIMAIIGLAVGLGAMVASRFGLGNILMPIGIAVIAATGVPIVTGIVGATV